MNETRIVIRENGEMAVEEKLNGVTSYKRIEPNDLIKCLNNSISRGGISSGLLPGGCLSFSYGDDGSAGITLLFPDRYADISYYNTLYRRFPLPRLVFGFNVNPEGRVSGCRMGVADTDVMLRPETRMFRYPFSNVSGFSLCTGNNALPKCKSLYTLGSLPHLIMAMPNNDDHFKPDCNAPRLQMRELLEHMKHKEPGYYYTDILVPFEDVTLQDFINQKAVF